MSRSVDALYFMGAGLVLSFVGALVLRSGSPVLAVASVVASVPFYCLAVVEAWEAVE